MLVVLVGVDGLSVVIREELYVLGSAARFLEVHIPPACKQAVALIYGYLNQ